MARIKSSLLMILLITLGLGSWWLLQNYNHLQKQLLEQQQSIQQLQNGLTSLQQASATFLEISSLIKQADIALTMDGNTQRALSLLLLAKDYARKLDNIPLQHAIAQDIATLQITPEPTPEDLVLQLAAISKQIMTLPPIPANIKVTPKKPEVLSGPKWRQVLQQALATLQNLVIIRKQTVEPLLAPQQLLTIRINLQAKLLEAEWAILHKNPKLYQHALEQTLEWLQSYFAFNHTATNALVTSLTNLKTIDVAPPLPKLEHTFHALQHPSQQGTQLL